MARLAPGLCSAVGACRKECNLTQQQLAWMLGISRQTVVEMERGGYNPSTVLALRLAVLLGVAVEDLFWLPEADSVELAGRRAQHASDRP